MTSHTDQASPLTQTTSQAFNGAPSSLRWFQLGCAAVWAVGLSACGDDASLSTLSGAGSTSHETAVVAEASAPLAMPAPADLAQLQAATDKAGGSDAAAATDPQRSKDTPPPRVERQMGEIAQISPGGFQLGGTRVVIDGTTTLDPPSALTEGEPVDVTGVFEADRKTLRATLVRSTRPAASPDSAPVETSAPQSS